jgi:hypothetical protein
LLSTVTSLATLGLASVTTGCIGLIGAAVMWRFVPETLRRPVVASAGVAPAPGDTS